MKTKAKTKGGKRRKMQKVMDEYKQGNLHSGSKTGPKVKSRAQAIAIGLNQSGQQSTSKRSKKSASAPSKRAARRKKLETVKL